MDGLGVCVHVGNEKPGRVGSYIHDGDAHANDPKGGLERGVCSRRMTWVEMCGGGRVDVGVTEP
jgi:hypothetical protein